MAIIGHILISIWIICTFAAVLGTIITLLSRRPRRINRADCVPLSILKPLKGIEPGLRRNLQSFFKLEYPEFELLFCISSAHDPARAVVENLMRRYPKTRARLVIGGPAVSINPKVNNLYGSYYRAIYDHIVISDSNVRVSPRYLKDLVSRLTPGVGVVTSLVTATGHQGLGGYLEASYLNSALARTMPLGIFVGLPLVIGKSMLLRRSIAERFGGLDFLGRYLAEDYMTGHSMKQLGLKIALTARPVKQYVGRRKVSLFWSRHIRWGRLRKAHAPIGFLLEPLLGAVIPGLIGALGFHYALGISYSTFVGVHFLIWAGLDAVLFSKNGTTDPFQWLAWFVREWLSLAIWAQTLLGQTVEWRGRRLKIQSGGELVTDFTNEPASELLSDVRSTG